MRTTITIDEDLALRLERERMEQHKSFKEYVNEILRAGFAQRNAPRTPPGAPFRTKSVHLGQPLVGEVHNIGELLAMVEGENYR